MTTPGKIFLQGDICIDEDVALTEPESQDVPPGDFWFAGGRSFIRSSFGGAGLTAQIVESILREDRLGAGSARQHSVTMEDRGKLVTTIRAFAKYKWCNEAGDGDKVWRIRQYLSPTGRRSRAGQWKDPAGSPQVVAIEDQQLGYLELPGGNEEDKKLAEARSERLTEYLRRSLRSEDGPLVILKSTDLLGERWCTSFWTQLAGVPRPQRAIGFTPLSDLQRRVAGIHPGLSWDKTVAAILREILERMPDGGARPSFVVQFDLEGVLVVSQDQGVYRYTLVYDPKRQPGDLKEFWEGDLSGGGSTIFATLIAEAYAGNPLDHRSLVQAAKLGLARARLLSALGYLERKPGEDRTLNPPLDILARFKLPPAGQTANPDRDDTLRDIESRTSLPVAAVDKILSLAAKLKQTEALRVPEPGKLRRGLQPGINPFRIVEAAIESKNDLSEKAALELARRVVCQGEKGLEGYRFPVEKIGKFVSIDPEEIENIRALRKLFRNYKSSRDNNKARAPLCVAVFGPPGSGKSFAVHEMTKDLLGQDLLEYNLSQFSQAEALIDAFHEIRDHVLEGKLPVVFWDEFDTPLDGQPLGWLRYFLAPMQDGTFVAKGVSRPIGKSVFIFGGGVAFSYSDFLDIAGGVQRMGAPRSIFGRKKRRGHAQTGSDKGPDFLSRLRGFLNIRGLELRSARFNKPPRYKLPQNWIALLTRAFIIRSELKKRCPELSMVSSQALGYLLCAKYIHGARSIGAIVEMSTVAGRSIFDLNCFPPRRLYQVHLDWRMMEVLRERAEGKGQLLDFKHDD